MHLSLPSEVERLIRERVDAGWYKTSEEVVVAAIGALDRQERSGDFEPGGMDGLIAAGEADIARGEVLDGDEALAQRRARRRT